MENYKAVYEFAASAGALEGYVYSRRKSEISDLDDWVRNLAEQYHGLPNVVRESFQSSLDRTLGRAVQSLIPMFGQDHHYIRALGSLIIGKMPDSPQDFRVEKADKAERFIKK
jgi:hypothetical protein